MIIISTCHKENKRYKKVLMLRITFNYFPDVLQMQTELTNMNGIHKET